MKILVIEDTDDAVYLVEALEGLGEISSAYLPMGKRKHPQCPLLPFKKVLKMIKKADVILLDHFLDGFELDGKDLLPYCEGKVVIGISGAVTLSRHEFSKRRLHGWDKEKVKAAREDLRQLVLTAVEESGG